MKYDTEALEELTQRVARFELPRMSNISMEEYVTSRDKGSAWYPCQYCGAQIERTLQYANRKFTCYQCRKDHQKKYDNSPVQIQKRKETRKTIQTRPRPMRTLTEAEKILIKNWHLANSL